MKQLGEIDIFLAALGLAEGDSGILPAIEKVGASFQLDELSAGGGRDFSYRFISKGVEFIFENRMLAAIMFYVVPHDDFSAFVVDEGFLADLSYTSSKTDVLHVFGVPAATGSGADGYVKYCAENRYVHFEFTEDLKIKRITVGLVA